MNNFTNAISPGLVSVLVVLTSAKPGDPGNGILFLFMIQQVFTVLSMMFLIFGPWKRWRCGAGFAYGLTIATFLVFPLG